MKRPSQSTINQQKFGGGFLAEEENRSSSDNTALKTVRDSKKHSDFLPFNTLIPPSNPMAQSLLKGLAMGDSDESSTPSCVECKDMVVDLPLWQWFHIAVCPSCKQLKPEKYGVLSRTESKEDYLLTDSELDSLPHVRRPNPKESRWHPMKLYLRPHVEALAVKKWGSLEAIDRASDMRDNEKKRRKEISFERKLKSLRRLQSGPRRREIRENNSHVHVYQDNTEAIPPAVSDKDTQSKFKIQMCKLCGMRREIEEM